MSGEKEFHQLLAEVDEATLLVCDSIAPSVAAFYKRLIAEGVPDGSAAVISAEFVAAVWRAAAQE
jgi:hypothetical protein